MHNELIRTPGGKLRARGAGIPFVGTPGRYNSITDVAGVEVGYCTLISGEGKLVLGQGPVRTGVTAILPRGRARGADGVFSGFFSYNGNGEMTGTAWIEEAGRCDGPITITNSHSVGLARDATVRRIVKNFPEKFNTGNGFAMPVAAETLDGFLKHEGRLEGHLSNLSCNALPCGGPASRRGLGVVRGASARVAQCCPVTIRRLAR